MKNLRLKEENTIIYVQNHFRLEELKTETIDNPINYQKKENKSIKDIILRDIRNLFGNEEEKNLCKPV